MIATTADQARFIMATFEGDIFTDDPIDTGGATRHGITLRTLQYARSKAAGHPVTVTKADVRNLSETEAIAIYEDVFARESRIAEIVSPGLRFSVFDYAVHSGWPVATKALQAALNAASGSVLAVDGRLGPLTLRAVNVTAQLFALAITTAQVTTHRQARMQAIIRAKPSQKKYQTGWWARTTTVLELSMTPEALYGSDT